MTYGAINVDSVVTSWGDTAVGLYGFKNRIINGAMMIDQRNAGATGTSASYTVDRWIYQATQTPKLTWGQNINSATPPAGFINYLGVAVSATATLGASDYFRFYQGIEGYNIADFGWGTANAKAATLSFYVYSSVTGSFGGSIQCGSGSYPFLYTISSANTWTYITVNIPANTAYAPASTTNGGGLYVSIAMGVGSTNSGTAGSWASGAYLSATGATSIVSTLNATFYITGVQLEKGATATSFDYRPYGTELALCQRYYEAGTFFSQGPSTGNFGAWVNYQVAKRASPTFAFVSPSGSGYSTLVQQAYGYTTAGTGYNVMLTAANGYVTGNWTSSAEL